MYGPDDGPTIVARCTFDATANTYAICEVVLGTSKATASLTLSKPSITIPSNLLSEGHSALKSVAGLTDQMKSAYAALAIRLTDLEIDRTSGFFGLPAEARLVATASITLPPIAAKAEPTVAGFKAQCFVELAALNNAVRGRLDFAIDYCATRPLLAGTFGWPSFGFRFADVDFSAFSLLDHGLDLPDPFGWIPNTKISWDAPPPSLTLKFDGKLSLAIDAKGAPASGTLELGATKLIAITAFKVAGPIDAIDVSFALTARDLAKAPDGEIEAGPLAVAWKGVTVSATAETAGLVITTHVERLAIAKRGDAEQIALSLDLVTRYDANNGVDTKFENVSLIEPTGTQLAEIGLRELGNLKRIVFPLTLPKLGNTDILLDRFRGLFHAVLSWLGAGSDAVGGALIGLGKGAAAFARWVFDALEKLDDSGAQLVVELRWDSARGILKQIVISRTGGAISVPAYAIGELKITLPETSQPMLVFDIDEQWMAVAVAPQAADFSAVFSTDLWVSGATGTTPIRGSDPKPLIEVTATLKPPAGDPEPIALVLLRDGRARFFQSLGGGPAETIAGMISLGSPLVPGPFAPDTNIDVKIDNDRLTAIFPTGSGSAGTDSTAPEVKVVKWSAPDDGGSVRKIIVNLEITVGAGASGPIEAEVSGSFDMRTLELRFDALQIPIPAPKPIDFFGATATIVANEDEHAFVLRIDEAASIALATGARAELRFNSIGEGDDALTFDASGPTGLALGASGLDLDAKVRENPIRLPGLDTPFRFTGGALKVERGRILSAGITGSGALPPALLGEAKIEAGIQLGRAEGRGALIVESATARLDRAGEPLICENTRFHFELTHVGLGFKRIDDKIFFFGELTGSATFRPNSGEFASGLLSRLPEIKVNFERAPIAGDGRALAKAINFQIPINPPARAKLFELFEFELRGIGFHPAYDGWADTPPTLSLSGQARMTESFDVVQTSFEAHQIYITRPAPKLTLPRIRMDGLGVSLRIAAMGEFSATALAVDGKLPNLFKPDVLPANVTANGFLASGRLMLKGWAAMSGAAGFLELAPTEDNTRDEKRLSFYIYAQQEKISEPIPTPVGTLYLREVGFGFGFRYTLAALAQTERLTDPRDIISTLDPLSQKQGDLSSFPAWQPELDGDRLTLAMRALFSVTTASSASVYNAEKEKELDNPVLFDVVAALRSDLTFLLSARAWLSVNYSDWLNGPKDWREKPVLRGYIYISAPKKIFLGRLIVDPKGHIGEHPKLPEPLLKALSQVKSATATVYITPDLFHQELGWPYELEVALGDPNGSFHAVLSGGMVLRIEDGAVLQGIAFKAVGHLRVGGRAGGSVGASAQALATFALEGKFLAYVSIASPAESLFYGRLSLTISLDFSIEFWVDTKFFSLSASWSEKIDVEIDLELAMGPRGIGGHARASLSIRRFGRGLRLGVSLGFGEGMIGSARGRVERFMALGLGATVPNPATGLPPLPETARNARAEKGDQALLDLAKRRESMPLPDPDAPAVLEPLSIGAAITGCDFWAIVMPIRGRKDEALLHLVPRDKDPQLKTPPDKNEAFFGSEHGDFFVSPVAAFDCGEHRCDGGYYILSDVLSATAPKVPQASVLHELKVPKGQVAGRPLWSKLIDRKSGSTVGDLVASGFLAADGVQLTQPKIDPVDPKEKRDTLGCIEARGALIGHVAEQARLLAENWTGDEGISASAEFDPRWFGLTFQIGDGHRRLADVLETLFPVGNDDGNPRTARFKVTKSDVADTSEEHVVQLYNPIDRWFENAQPRLADPCIFLRGQTLRLAWDLEPRWGASRTRYDDPEFHVMHYAVRRYIVVEYDMSRRYHASWLAKGADQIDMIDGIQDRDYQVIDRLENLPEALRSALVLSLSAHADEADIQQPEAHAAACDAWEQIFGPLHVDRGGGEQERACVELFYTIVPIDNSGTKGDASEPIRLKIFAPLPKRERAFRQVNLSFDYFKNGPKEIAFPSTTGDLPTRLSVAISTKDMPTGIGTIAVRGRATEVPPLPAIELYFDSTHDPRSGIFGADLLDADRHRYRVVSADLPYSALLQPGAGSSDSIRVELLEIDPNQTDLTLGPVIHSYHLSASDFALLVKSPRQATQIFARWERSPESEYRPAPWTRCDLKLRVAQAQTGAPHPRHDDFVAPIAEFEQPLSVSHRLLPEGAMIAEQGILHKLVPSTHAVLTADAPACEPTRDVKDRRGIRLAWNARPQHDCDGGAIKPDHVGGFDLFVSSRDRETDPELTADAYARLAQPLGRILVKPAALLNSEPAQIEDFSKLDVAYPSAAAIAKGQGWYSAAESRLIWPAPVPRRSLMLVPDEGLIGAIFAHGTPKNLRIRFASIEAKPQLLQLTLAAHGAIGVTPELATLERYDGGWHTVIFLEDTTPKALRQLMQRLMWSFEDRQQPLRASLHFVHDAGDHEVEVSLGGEVHPILADLTDLLRYKQNSFEEGTGYRRYEPVLEGAPSPIANTAEAAAKSTQMPQFAQLLSDTAEGSDKAGWAALRQLGLAIGFRLWDTETSDWVDPGTHRQELLWAWRVALARCHASQGDIGAPFLEQFYDPEELFTISGEDLQRPPRKKTPRGLPLLQASLRPIPDRMLKDDDSPALSIHYLSLELENAIVHAAHIDQTMAVFGPGPQGRGYVQLLTPALEGQDGTSVWVGAPIKDAQGLKPEESYAVGPKRTVLARIVLIGRAMTAEDVGKELRRAIEDASSPGASITAQVLNWSPADDVAAPKPNPYLRFEAVPAELAALIEVPSHAPINGRNRLKTLASRRFAIPAKPDASEALALQRWERRFFELGSGTHLKKEPSVGVAFATIDAPASLRRAPDHEGKISILYLDEGQLGSWRRFYVRPFGRYDHLAQASGWLEPIENQLKADDFGATIDRSARPWLDVTLARSRPLPKPVLLASGYSADAKALVLVAARSDQEILADANVPQSGSAQINSLDIGFNWRLDEARTAWATAHHAIEGPLPNLTPVELSPADTDAFVEWFQARARPPRQATPTSPASLAPDNPLPDLWRGATGVAAYDLPYFFSYSAQLSASAGTATSALTHAELPSPQPVDFSMDLMPDWTRVDDEVVIRLPLARFVDCMDSDSRSTWYPKAGKAAALFELPDPAIVYRIYLRSPLGDMWSSEIDIEAQPAQATYTARVTGQTFATAQCDVPERDGSDWSLTVRVTAHAFDHAIGAALFVVPVRQTHAMKAIRIEEAS